MRKTEASEGSPRRRQEDRTAETRRRLVEATITCLYKVGYSAVTISMVAEQAGVSRGLIGYHFPTKADLMVAVRDAVYIEERRVLEAKRGEIGTRDYLARLPRFVVDGMRREPAVAVNEILLGARADTELLTKLRETERRIEERVLAELGRYYEELGIEPPTNLPVVMRVAVAAFRGLAISELVQGPDAEVDASIEYLMEWMGSLARGVSPAQAGGSGD